MDPYTQSYMIFTIIMTVIIGGFIVTFPVMRRLGILLEESIRERRASRLDGNQVREITTAIQEVRGTVETLEGHVGLLSERQEFVENLLSRRDPERLSDGDDWRS